MTEIYVVEWSFKQKCFHIETLNEMIFSNYSAFRENRNTEYIPILIVKSHNDARKAIEELHQIDCESTKAINKKWKDWIIE